MGIAALPWYVAHDSLKAARVVEGLKTCRLPKQEIHAVVFFRLPSSSRDSARDEDQPVAQPLEQTRD